MKPIFLDDIFMNEGEISMGEKMKMRGLKSLNHCQVHNFKTMIQCDEFLKTCI
jgi:hypothetical protein